MSARGNSGAGLLGALFGLAATCCGECQAAAAPTIAVSIDIPANRRFPSALDACLDGRRITRAGWNGTGMHVEAQFPDEELKNTDTYLVLVKPTGRRVPWVPSQGDLCASDWAIHPVAT